MESTSCVGLVLTFNQANTIISAVDSLISQTRRLSSIIVSDDCSTDNTCEVVKCRYAQEILDGRIQVLRNSSNLGFVSHFNHVVSQFRDERTLLFYNAGDDISHPERVREFLLLYQSLGQPRYFLGHSYVSVIDADSDDILVPPILSIEGNRELIAISSAYHIGASQVFTPALFTDFGQINYDDCYEDLTLGYRAVLTNAYHFIEKPLLGYRTGGLSSWQKNPLEKKRRRFCATLNQRVTDALRSGDTSDFEALKDCYLQYGFSISSHSHQVNFVEVSGESGLSTLQDYSIVQRIHRLNNMFTIKKLDLKELMLSLQHEAHRVTKRCIYWIVMNTVSEGDFIDFMTAISFPVEPVFVLDFGLHTPADLISSKSRWLPKFLERFPNGYFVTACEVSFGVMRGYFPYDRLCYLAPLQDIDGVVAERMASTSGMTRGLIVLGSPECSSLQSISFARSSFRGKRIVFDVVEPFLADRDTHNLAQGLTEGGIVYSSTDAIDYRRYEFAIIFTQATQQRGLLHHQWASLSSQLVPSFIVSEGFSSESIFHGKNALIVDNTIQNWCLVFNIVDQNYSALRALASEARRSAYFNMSIQKKFYIFKERIRGFLREEKFFDRFNPL